MDFRHFGFTSFGGPSFLIVDAVPAEAQIFLDGRPLGSAAELLARALPLGPGRHTVQVLAPGFRPYAAQFVADPSFSSRQDGERNGQRSGAVSGVHGRRFLASRDTAEMLEL